MRKYLLIICLFTLSLVSSAQIRLANFAGYISLQYISGTTYQATVTLYSEGNLHDTAANYWYSQQDTIRLYYGDGTSALLYRSNGPIISPDTIPRGDTLCNEYTTINKYIGQPHTFPGAGSYHIWYDSYPISLPYNIINIPIVVDMLLWNTLVIDPFSGSLKSTPTITTPLVCTFGCTNQCYYFNYNAIVPTGDSISYMMTTPLTYGGVPPPGYFIPPGAVVDPVMGTVSWCHPTTAGQYLLAVDVITYSPAIISGKKTMIAIDTTEAPLYIIINSTCPTGINEVTTSNTYSIYPNPTNNIAYINSSIEESGTITIYNVLGQAIRSTQYRGKQTEINTSGLNASMYFVNIRERESGKSYTLKLIKD